MARDKAKDLPTETKAAALKVITRVIDRNWDAIFATYREGLSEAEGTDTTFALRVGMGLKLSPFKGDVKVTGSLGFGIKTKDEDTDFASIQEKLPGHVDPVDTPKK